MVRKPILILAAHPDEAFYYVIKHINAICNLIGLEQGSPHTKYPIPEFCRRQGIILVTEEGKLRGVHECYFIKTEGFVMFNKAWHDILLEVESMRVAQELTLTKQGYMIGS